MMESSLIWQKLLKQIETYESNYTWNRVSLHPPPQTLVNNIIPMPMMIPKSTLISFNSCQVIHSPVQQLLSAVFDDILLGLRPMNSSSTIKS